MTEIRVTDTGTWRIPDISHTHRGRGLLLAGQLVEELSLDHLPADAAHGEQEPPGRGTVVRVRHRLHRPAILAPTPIPGRRPLPTPASRPYTTELEPGSSAPRLRVAGPIDITTAEDLEQELLRACRGATLNLEIDLSEVTHLHSAGVALLHRLRDKLQAQHRELRLLTPPGSTAATVLDLVRLPHTTISTAPNL
jgi:anti-anti-sigma factor